MKMSRLKSLIVLFTLAATGCSNSTSNNNPNTGGNGGGNNSSADTVYYGPKAGSTFSYSMIEGSRSVSDWDINVDQADVSAHGMQHTMHWDIAPRDGTEMSKRIHANGDVDIWNPLPGTGGWMTGTVVPLNRWIRYPMDGVPGRHTLVDTMFGNTHVTKHMDVLGIVTMQTSAGPVKTIHYIENDSAFTNGSGNLDKYEIWFAPSYGTFVKSVNLYNGFWDTLTVVSLQ